MEFDLEQLQRDWIVGISGQAFFARVQDCRARFKDIPPNVRVCGVQISEKDPIQFAVEFFAAVWTGLPIVLVNPNWGANERQQFAALVTPGIYFDKVGVLTLAVASDQADRLKAGLQPLTPGSILIPTGGTTGGVKLAIHDWSSLSAASAGVQEFLGGEPIDSCCLLPLYHVSGLMQLVRSFLSGGGIRFDDRTFEGYCLSLVPTQLQRLLGDSESIQKLNTARAIFVGGAAMPQSVAAKAREHKLPIIPVYGMTETAAMCAAVSVEDFLNDTVAGALPIAGASFHVEVDGRIRIQSPALFKGYQGHLPQAFSQGYLTDDLGRIDASGGLHIEGRADRLLISGGEKIDPLEVEQAICKLPNVEAALAVGLPDAEWGQHLIVFYTGTEITGWQTQLKVSLANYKIPKRLIRVTELPFDTRGKTDWAEVERLVGGVYTVSQK